MANIETRRWEIEEIKTCAKDPVYFIEKYLEIQHPMKGRIKFELYGYQKKVIQALQDNRYNIILKSRQLGLSTVVAAYCLWLVVFHRDKNILFLADGSKTSKEMIQKTKIAWQSLPDWMLNALKIKKLIADSTTHIKLANGSRIEALTSNTNAGRGQAASLVIADEAGVIPRFNEIWSSVLSTTTTGGSVVVFGTPKTSVGHKFYELWENASLKKNNFAQMELPWDVHPEHDQAWFDNETKNMDQQQIGTEMECRFIGSGDNAFFDFNAINHYSQTVKEPIAYDSPENYGTNDFWIWEYPIAEHKYIISGDIALGSSKDYSAMHVIDTETDELVAEYFGKLPPDRFGEYLIKIGNQYNTATIIIERNSLGLATAIKLRDEKYPNLYYQEKKKKEVHYPGEELERLCGVHIDGFNREVALNDLEEIVRHKKIGINSSRLLDQMKVFQWNGKRGQGPRNKSDDLITSLAILFILHKPRGFRPSNKTNDQGDWHNAFLNCLKPQSQTITQGYGLSKFDQFVSKVLR